MLGALLFVPLFRAMPLWIDGDGDDRGDDRGGGRERSDHGDDRRDLRLRSSARLNVNVDQMQLRTVEAVRPKESMQSNIAAVKLGVNRCALCIEATCEEMVRAIRARSKRLHDALRQYERESVEPLIQNSEAVDGTLAIWKRAQRDLCAMANGKMDGDVDMEVEDDEEKAIQDKLARILEIEVASGGVVGVPKFVGDANGMARNWSMRDIRRGNEIDTYKL